MKKLKIIGYSITKEHADAHSREYQDHDEGNITYHFLGEVDNKYYRFKAVDSYGSCGSGWTSASWGDIDFKLHPTTDDSCSHITKKDIYIGITEDNQIIKSVEDPGEYFDATVESIHTTDNELLVSSTGDGGCNYYPSGIIKVNAELFKDV